MQGLPFIPGLTAPLIPGLLPSGGLLLPPPLAPTGSLNASAGELVGTGLLSTGSNPLLPGAVMSMPPPPAAPAPPPAAGADSLRPGDWKCPSCGFHVYASRDECPKCNTKRPEDADVTPAADQRDGAEADKVGGAQSTDQRLNILANINPPPPAVLPPEAKAPGKWPVFVGNIGYETTVEDVREIFEGSKGLLKIELATDSTGSRGFAFAEYDTREAAEEAMKTLDNKEIKNGRAIRLRWGNTVSDPKPTVPTPPAPIDKVLVPFRLVAEGFSDFQKQTKAYHAILGAGASHMRFMMKKTGCRLQLRGAGSPGTVSTSGTTEPLHIMVRPGPKSEDGLVKAEQVTMIKQIVDQILKFGQPLDINEVSKDPCPGGLRCSDAGCLLTHPRVPGVEPQADASATAKFFMIRFASVERLHTTLNQGVWATNKTNTKALEEAFKSKDHVILLFYAEDSIHLQGFARMETAPDPDLLPCLWGQKTIGETFSVKWIKKCMLPLKRLCRLSGLNGLVLDKTEDGDEIPEHAAETITRLMLQQEDADFSTLPADVEAPFDMLYSCRSKSPPKKAKSRSRSKKRKGTSPGKRSRSRKRSRSAAKTSATTEGDAATATADGSAAAIALPPPSSVADSEQKASEKDGQADAAASTTPAEPTAEKSTSEAVIVEESEAPKDNGLVKIQAVDSGGPAWSKKPKTASWSVPAQQSWSYGTTSSWSMPAGQPQWPYGGYGAAAPPGGMPPAAGYPAPGAFPGMPPPGMPGAHGMPPGMPGMPPGMPFMPPGGAPPGAGPPGWPMPGWRPP